MKTSCLVDKEPGLPLSLPPSSTDVRLEVEEAELGRGLVGSLVTSEPGVLVSTCATAGGQGEGWALEAPDDGLHFTIPRRGTWRSVHRAAGWASRGGEPEVARRLCPTSISLDRTTAPQRPAGGTRCRRLQLDLHWRRPPDVPLSPCTWKSRTERAEKSEPQQSKSMPYQPLFLHQLTRTCRWRETGTRHIGGLSGAGDTEELGHVPCAFFACFRKRSLTNRKPLFHTDQWKSGQSPVLCVSPLCFQICSCTFILHFPFLLTKLKPGKLSNF